MKSELLALAQEMAESQTNGLEEASLRRATATAYYALFHALAEMCADQFVGDATNRRAYVPVYRALDHKTARSRLDQTRSDPDLMLPTEKIRLAFVNLQGKRIEADYIPGVFGYSEHEVRDLITEARAAIDAIERLPSDTKILLAVQLLTNTR